MNLDSLSFALSQISYSVANLTKKNYKSSVAEISHLVAQHGAEAERHLFRCLFSHVDFSGDGKSSGKDFHQTQYLIQECTPLLSKPNFVSTLCYAIDNPLHHQKSLKASVHLFTQLSKTLKLNKVQEVVFGLAQLNSTNPEIRTLAGQFVKNKLPQLLNAYVDERGEGGLQEIAVEVIHLILTNLIHNQHTLGITPQQKEAFLKTLRKDFTPEQVPVVLAPLLYPDPQDTPIVKLVPESVNMPKTAKDGSLADMVLEVGYGFTSSEEECRTTMLQFGVREITAESVARVLGSMASTTTGLTDPISVQSMNSASSGGGGLWMDGKEKPESGGPTAWNIDVFITVVKELTPHIVWREVVAKLDYPEFIIHNKAGLRLLMQGLFRCFLMDVFPIDLLYQPWKNSEGQLSLINQALKNPDVFCLADYPCKTVAIDVLKTPPDEDNRDIATWKSHNLVETLLHLAEAGHHQQVSELYKFPVQHCPDMLVLALLQIMTWTRLKHDLLSNLMPIFLGNHPNSAIVLHYAWHCQSQSTTIRTLVMHAMAEWYMRGEHHDQTRLSRILDVAQDLKALSMLLNATPFAFVIDLACLASRREYLKLDKWLSDKIREHGEPFVQASVSFLKRRCPQLLGSSMKDENQPQAKSQQIPTETLTTMLACLHACTGNVAQELSDAINTMVANANMILKPRNAPPSNVVGPPKAGTIAPPNPIPGLPTPVGTSPMDTMSSLGQALGPVGGLPVPPLGVPPTSSVSAATTPLNMAPSIQSHPNYNPMQSLTPQLHGLSLSSPMSIASSLPGPSLGGTSMLGAELGAPTGALSQAGSLSQGLTSTVSSAAARTSTLGPLAGAAGPAGAPKIPQGASERLVNQQFPKEIEDEANSYFQRIYNHPPHPTISIDEVLEMLKRFKDSPVKKEREVFSCMLRNLFEEYRFFPQYPDKELHTTAVLFGGIIEQGLVTYMDLGIALRYVLEALRKAHASKMYYFGIAALDRFKTRLKDYPQYCQHLASIPHFSQFPSHLIEYVEYGARSQGPANRPQGSVSPSLTPNTTTVTSNPTPTSVVTSSPATTPTQGNKSGSAGSAPAKGRTEHPSIANATNIDTLLAGTEGSKEEILVPPETLQDKVFFIFNNLSLANMDIKAAELLEHTTDEYLPWVAQYMVMKRASIEPNFHRLYANFIDCLKRPEFFHMVIRETFRNIKVLLRSDKGVNNFSDRSLLKNLGHWLGLLTLAKNKPILHVDIDLKSLLYEAYYKGAQELLFVVPFVAKVIESCSKSKVFKPPNPWSMGIMNVLAELHQVEGLKLNLKFEIEVLCKTLNLDINNDLKAANFLNDQERSKVIENQLSAPKPKEAPSTPQPEEPMPGPFVTLPAGVATTTVHSTTPTTSTTTTTPSLTTPPQPQFLYQDINVMSLAGMAPHITINDQLSLFAALPRLKQFVVPAIEHSVQELLPVVVERSIKISLTTCEQIVRKDFALDPEEARMRAAAHHMVRNMTAGMALITCREPLLISITNNLKNAFLTSLGGASQQQKELIEQAAQVISQENTELACAFIQKTAVEKAIPEMDKRLATEFELRKHARNEGRRYCDPGVLTYQAERMPEQIRLKVGGVTPQQIAVYEEFARNIPGFLAAPPITAPDTTLFNKPAPQQQPPAPQPQPPQPPPPQQPQQYLTDDFAQIADKIAREIEQHLHSIIVPPNGNPQVAQLHMLLEATLYARNQRDYVMAGPNLLQKAVEGLLDGFQSIPQDPEINLIFRDCHLLVLKGLQDQRAYGLQWVNKQVTRCLIECREEFKYNLEAVEALIRSHLVNMQQYDAYLATACENGLNYMAVAFAFQLVQRFCLDDKHGSTINEADFYATIETLGRIAAHSRQAPEGLTNLIETLRSRGDGGPLDRAPMMMRSGISQAREFDDPPGLHEKTEYLLREWVNMYHSPAAGRDSTKAFSAFVTQMHQHGILKTDDLITRFFRLCTEMCVDLCYRALAEQTPNSSTPQQTMVRTKCFHTLDAFVRLISLLVKHSGDSNNTATKINLLSKVLGIVAGVLLQDHEVRNAEFQQLPYHRIFIMLFIELNVPEYVLESINTQVLTAFCNAFHILRPAKAPGFAYAWLELISHRVFIGRLLAVPPQQRGWNMYAQLLIDLFKFLAPFLRNADLVKPLQVLYKGTLRVLLVLLHDFPEFFCDYHYAFCDVIPPNCIQMRNLILSAFPRNMRLPDPFTPNLKVDMLTEISHPPRIMSNYAAAIQPANFKKDLDSYLKSRSPVTFLSELRSNLQLPNEPGNKYNVQMMNALVLYVGTQAITHIHNKGLTPSMSTIAHSSHMDIFQNLAVDLDTKGRYLFLTSIANQLRYPNSHTHYFSCTLLYLFAEANTEAIQEQITRVLLERLIVNRPHPWGLLITFIELIKNPQFKFWTHDFVHCAPEIAKLFDSVARSCMGQPRQPQVVREQESQEVH